MPKCNLTYGTYTGDSTAPPPNGWVYPAGQTYVGDVIIHYPNTTIYPAYTIQPDGTLVPIGPQRLWLEDGDSNEDWVNGYKQWKQGQTIGPEEAMRILESLGKGEWPFGKIEAPQKGEQLEFSFVRQMRI